jgi:hypothetical protein
LLVVVGAFVVRDGLETAHDLSDEFIGGRAIAGGADELRRDALRIQLDEGRKLTVTPRALEAVFAPGTVPPDTVIANTALPATAVMVTGPGDPAPEGLTQSGTAYPLLVRVRPPFDDFLDYYRWAFSRAPATQTLSEGQLWLR